MSGYYDCIIIGAGLIKRMQEQAVAFETEMKTSSEVIALEKLQDDDSEVSCDKNKYIARAANLASDSHIHNTGNNKKNKNAIDIKHFLFYSLIFCFVS